MNDRKEFLRVDRLSFSYGEEAQPAISELSFTVNPGELLVLFGPSGCGKSTLLRLLKPSLTPEGTVSGQITLEGKPIAELPGREACSTIGFVQQSPEAQIVTDRVWHELAFGLESLGCEEQEIRRRVAETASYFGMTDWFRRPVNTLSGGQKQLLALASVMVMRPKLLLLDEPTSQLDPIAAGEFMNILQRLNRELGLTVIMTEHRLEEAIPVADRIGALSNGKLISIGTPKAIAAQLAANNSTLTAFMPAAARIWSAVETEGENPPISVREGRQWLSDYGTKVTFAPVTKSEESAETLPVILQAEEIHYRYEESENEVLRGLNLKLSRGELYAMLGSNGAGKSTALKVLGGLRAPARGTVTCRGRTGLLPQDPTVLFHGKTVLEDLKEVGGRQEQVSYAVRVCMLENLLCCHPYDLSGGEQQRAALAKLLITEPEILLLDEPTKGLDRNFQNRLGTILRTLQQDGVGILMVSHDVEFCAEWANRCGLLFDGEILSEASPREFFSGMTCYTTSAMRISRDILDGAVTTADVISACRGKVSETVPIEKESRPASTVKEKEVRPLPLWRKVIAAAAAVVFFAAVFRSAGLTEAAAINDLGVFSAVMGAMLPNVLAACCAFAVLSAALYRRTKEQAVPVRAKPGARTILSVCLSVLLIPVTLFFGLRYTDGKQYLLISVMILVECMLPFFLTFEGRKPQSRELVLIAVLSALAVAGRAAFFMLPEFKPVLAIVILSGAAFGGETGFLVGAMSMLASNALFGQGPWTPWQMFAMGLCGLISGLLFRTGLLCKNRLSLCIFGFIAAVVFYGFPMNFASLLMAGSAVSLPAAVTMEMTGLPVDCVHGLATVLFLALGGPAVLEKLNRVRKKYGL